ncbi:MAG TPA: response regulator [Bryobacteraceae bacterium]
MEQKPLHVLLIEDNPADVVLTRMTLKESGRMHELLVIGDGEAALAYLRVASPAPDLIVLDLNLPKLDGFAVLEQLRGMPAGGRVPVAVLTSSQLAEDRERALKLGAGAFLEKPGSLSGYRDLAREFESLCQQLA